MKYILNSAAEESPWLQHEFYKSAIVLGLDSGIDGIGVSLRKGPDILFAQTFLVGDTTRTLEERRLKRGWRRSRQGRKKRENLIKDWAIRHKILTKERINEIWHDPKVFQNAFQHRLRGMKQKLGTAEALVSCFRHAIQHRGFDYHLTGDTGFPWGDALDFLKIIQWAKTGCCPRVAADQWKLMISESDFSQDEKKMTAVSTAFAEAVDRFEKDEIERILKNHLHEEKHTNRRPAARGYHFPRELIKAHVRKICEHNEEFFSATDYQKAVNELIGPDDNKIYEWKKDGCIIDYHRKTVEEVEKLWERKTNECPYLFRLLPDGEYREKVRCSPNHEITIRKFKLLQFLAERSFIISDGLKYHATKGVFDRLIAFVEQDAKAVSENQERPKLDKKELKEFVVSEATSGGEEQKGKKTKKSFQKKSDHNDAFLNQLYDLLSPKRSFLKQRSTLSAAAAEKLFNEATSSGSGFNPEDITLSWEGTYYLWRMEPRSGGRVHPHVQFLLGHPNQYADGNSKDVPLSNGSRHVGARLDGAAQEHGILRKLFASQLQNAMGQNVNLSAQLQGKIVPDYVIIETIGEIPAGPLQKKAIETRQKENRLHKEKLAGKYHLGDNPRRSDLLRVVLFEQQIPEGGTGAICPVSGESLGTNPLDTNLQIAHIFPNSKGGIFERLNLFITTAPVNLAMGNRTPKGCSGTLVDGQRFLGWGEMKEIAGRKMRWGKQKRELFLRETDEIPDWQNLTRISQLARQLKVEIERWLGINKAGSALERTRQAFSRIGTPTGSMTAACRHAWRESLPSFMTEKKHRCYLRHHLYDAIVLSHIPAGTGMNFVGNGGIFNLQKDKRGNPVVSAIKGLLPDLSVFEKKNSEECLVHKHRPKKSKQSRTEQTIYSSKVKRDGEAPVRLRVRKPLLQAVQGKNTFVPSKNAEKWIRESGIPMDKLPPKVVEAWASSDGAKPLRLIDGTRVESVPVSTTSEQITSLFPHKNRVGEVVGFKTATEVYSTCQIWEGPKRLKDGLIALDSSGHPVLHCIQILVPPARNLASYKREYGRPWKPEVKIPADFKKIGQLKKGDILRIPLDAAGDILPSKKGAARVLLFRVGSIKANGQLDLRLAEFDKDGLDESPWSGLAAVIQRQPSSAQVIAGILKFNQT